MPKIRADEEWVRGVVASTLETRVEQYDDGSRPGMHDLRIVRGDGDEALEVTAAADPAAIQLWKLLNGAERRWIVPTLAGGWRVELTPTANAKRILRELPSLLAELERRGVEELESDYLSGPLVHQVRQLGITAASQGPTDYPGSIYPLIDQKRWILPPTASPRVSVSSWITGFLSAPERSDVRRKLARSGADRRHAFILVPAFSIVPVNVVRILIHDDEPEQLPPPNIPSEVTDVWVASTLALGSGVRWSADGGWERFSTKLSTDNGYRE
jgi:hypothetical protein